MDAVTSSTPAELFEGIEETEDMDLFVKSALPMLAW
jgi:hypothetical protein